MEDLWVACRIGTAYGSSNEVKSLELDSLATEIDVTSLLTSRDYETSRFSIMITSSLTDHIASKESTSGAATLTITYNTACGANDQVCADHSLGVVCYNPNHSTCAVARTLAGWPYAVHKLCASGNSACYVNLSTPTCYSPSLYSCNQDTSQRYKLCPVGTNTCGDACYDPSNYSCCIFTGELCQIGDQNCCK